MSQTYLLPELEGRRCICISRVVCCGGPLNEAGRRESSIVCYIIVYTKGVVDLDFVHGNYNRTEIIIYDHII